MANQKHRLHALCPYFAMFPHTFVREHVLAHTSPGDAVLDPFSGRGTTLLESLISERQALALDINPVAVCITGAKANVPDLPEIEARLDELEHEYEYETMNPGELDDDRRALPEFFDYAFHYKTLREIMFIRARLSWKYDVVDRFIAGLALGSLHGEMNTSSSYFSNQMPRTISTKPDYSIRYWLAHGLKPQRRRVFGILRNRARFRLLDGRPPRQGIVVEADVREASRQLDSWRGKIRAVITSPPYLNVTNFEEDQWLRLWFLGGPPKPTYRRISRDDRHSNSDAYWRFLAEAWRGVADLLEDGAVIVCRIGGKKQSLDALAHGLLSTLRAAIPTTELSYGPIASVPLQRQTSSFRPGVAACGFEADFVFRT